MYFQSHNPHLYFTFSQIVLQSITLVSSPNRYTQKPLLHVTLVSLHSQLISILDKPKPEATQKKESCHNFSNHQLYCINLALSGYDHTGPSDSDSLRSLSLPLKHEGRSCTPTYTNQLCTRQQLRIKLQIEP